MNARKEASATTARDIVKACDALLDSGAIVRNASGARFVSAASVFMAMASDLAHTVKMFLDSAKNRTPHCMVHDADDPIPGRICGHPLVCPDHGVAVSFNKEIVSAARKLAFCEHPSDKLTYEARTSTCASCGAVQFQDSGWALPLRLVMVQSLLHGLDEDRLRALQDKRESKQ
jgi:hypothetical protein